MLLLFLVLFGAAFYVLTERYRGIEDSQAAAVALRASEAMVDETAQLDRVAATMAARDDLYAFMKTRKGEILADDLAEETLARQRIGFVVLLDKSGQPVHAAAMDLDLGEKAEPAAGLVSAISAASHLRTPGDPRGSVKGIVRLPGGVAFIASRPVTTGDMYGAPQGTLIIGRFIDASEIDRLSISHGWTLQAQVPPKTIPRGAIHTRAAEAAASRVFWWDRPDPDTIHAYAQIDDVTGEPALALRVTLPRDARHGLETAILYAGFALLVMCCAATLSVYWLLNWAVLGRLDRLSRQVQTIGRHGDSSERVVVEGNDELADVAKSVNGMLISLEATEAQLRQSRDSLETRVAERPHELFLSDARHRELIESMADAVFSVDLEGVIVLVNQQAVEITGRTRDELLGMRLVDLATPGTGEQVLHHLREVTAKSRPWTVEARVESVGRDPIPVELRAAPVADENGGLSGTQWIARDVAERLKFEQQLVFQATHDSLTGLSNRCSFETALEREIAEALRGGDPGAVIWLDLDDFKDLNDTLGHAAGDEALVLLAGVLNRNVRATNTLARVGGDEFAILLPRVTREEAEAAADRILSSVVSFTCLVEGRSVRFGASLGVVFFPENGSTVGEVMSNADAAMYRAKDRGRSTVYVTSREEGSDGLHVSRMNWNERITVALAEEGFTLYAQPILDLRSGSVVRHELLIRMKGEGGRLYPPSEFLPVAERLGLITEIDRWVLRTAIGLLKANDPDICSLEVNLSGKAFADAEMIHFAADQLERSGVDPKRLGFEITETAAIADMARAQWFIESFKDMGCRFSLDDFGSGFSSFYYLKHLPVDCLKIDGSYVSGLSRSEQDRCLIRGIREMCSGLGVEVLAECVEDQDTLDAVAALGLDYAQGYHVGRPAPLSTAGFEEE
jgi:diguanylate cyclase (GGDEF)-like protein/PAS domain S-box-containing protein